MLLASWLDSRLGRGMDRHGRAGVGPHRAKRAPPSPCSIMSTTDVFLAAFKSMDRNYLKKPERGRRVAPLCS